MGRRARPVKRVTQKEIETVPSRLLLQGKVGYGQTVEVGYADDKRLRLTPAAARDPAGV